MKGNVENCLTTRVARVNTMDNTKKKFPDSEQQKSSCMNAGAGITVSTSCSGFNSIRMQAVLSHQSNDRISIAE